MVTFYEICETLMTSTVYARLCQLFVHDTQTLTYLQKCH